MRRRLVDTLGASLLIAAAASAPIAGAQDGLRGAAIFDGACAHCHGADGSGGPIGPAIFGRVGELADDALAEFLRAGVPDRGMPPAPVAGGEMSALIGYLRTLVSSAANAASASADDAPARNASADVAAAASAFDAFLPLGDARPDLRAGDWLGGSGAAGFSPLEEIGRETVSRLTLAWSRGLPAGPLVPSPIVYGGVMYIVMPDESAAALDAATGDVLWQRAARDGAAAGGNAARAGSAAGADANPLRPQVAAPVLHEDALYYVSPHAVLVALDARTGALRFEAPLTGDASGAREDFAASYPPIFADGRVVTQICGPAVCTMAVLDARTGEVLWRDDAAPAWTGTGEPGSVPGGAMLVTGAGLIFQSRADRRFAALDARTGEVLWQTILGSGAVTFVLGYTADDRQHVAAVNGGLPAQTAAARADGWGGPGALYVFALPPAGEQDR